MNDFTNEDDSSDDVRDPEEETFRELEEQLDELVSRVERLEMLDEESYENRRFQKRLIQYLDSLVSELNERLDLDLPGPPSPPGA